MDSKSTWAGKGGTAVYLHVNTGEAQLNVVRQLACATPCTRINLGAWGGMSDLDDALGSYLESLEKAFASLGSDEWG